MRETRRPSSGRSPWRWLALLAAYTAFVIYGSLVPLRYEPLSPSQAVARFREIPFLQLGVAERADWVANGLLFVPLAFLASGLAAGRRRGWRALVALPLVLLACGALSVGIEFAQLWFPQRTVSQNDIAAEILGAVVGVGMWLAIGPGVAHWLDAWSRDKTPASRLDALLWLYAIGLAVYSVMPLDLTISLSELFDKYRAGRINVVPFRFAWPVTMQSAYELLRDVATFVPVGALACRQWPADTSRAKLIGGGGAGIAFVAGIEGAQTLVLSRFADVTDIITGGLGVAIGVLVAGHRRDAASAAPRPPGSESPTPGTRRTLAWLVASAIGYTALLFAAAWHPFEFNFDPAFLKPRVQSFITPPLTTLYLSPEFAALTNALSHIAWFVPLGVLADWCSRRGATHAATRRALLTLYLLLVLAAAGGMEAGQIAIPARTASLDGVILRALGAGVGVAVSRFLAPTRHRDDAG